MLDLGIDDETLKALIDYEYEHNIFHTMFPGEPTMDYQRVTDTEPFTKLKISTPYSTVTIEVEESDHTIQDLMNDLIRPALLAMGYAESLVNQYIPE